MTKDDLIESVFSACGTDVGSKAAMGRVVSTVFDTMAKGMKRDAEVRIHGFGSFKVKQRAAKVARNPTNGEPVNVPARKAVTFKPATALKEEMNRKGK